ncbi:hypothetical protein BT63DRAFT_238894 [Microthyrium microscopicum]|uniref:HECT-type E3 ubiquitin transferase n=1 Tax=Microthyrium microscopicum TaxID=703497 RepID=A0A6A6UFW4_9PEZI|nr:hypothetical protein BT63DRAFT_238894 [Microthyrium microscopicum]
MAPENATNGSHESAVRDGAQNDLLAQQYEFQYLVRRFEIQIRYGCKSSHCSARYCFSCRQQNATPPVRRPSPLTSRIMAFHLATGQEPYDKLCANEPVILPEHLSIEQNTMETLFKEASGRINMQLRPIAFAMRSVSDPRGRQVVSNQKALQDYWAHSFQHAPGIQPDRKSLVQKLFATRSVRNFLWKMPQGVPFQVMRDVLGLSPSRQVIHGQWLFLSDYDKVQPTEPAKNDDERPSPPTIRSDSVASFQMAGATSYEFSLDLESAIRLKAQDRDNTLVLDEGKRKSQDTYIKTSLQLAFGPEGLPFTARLFRKNWHWTFEDMMEALDWRGLPSHGFLLNQISRGLDQLFIPPSEWKFQDLPASANGNTPAHVYVGAAIPLLAIAMVALIAPLIPANAESLESWDWNLHASVAEGHQFEDYSLGMTRALPSALIDQLDFLNSEPAVELATKIVRICGARRAFEEAEHSGADSSDFSETLKYLQALFPEDLNYSPDTVFATWLMTILYKNWDGSLIQNRWQPCGAALELLNEWSKFTGSPTKLIHFDRLWPEYESKWLLDFQDTSSWKTHNTLHVMQFADLHPWYRQIKSFRTLNYARMTAAFRKAGYMEGLTRRLMPEHDEQRRLYLQDRMEKAASKYLLLNVRRDYLIEDTFDQLWGREPRELLRPLKVRLGQDSGEAGVDQGGVSQEYFLLVFEKVFNPDSGKSNLT